MKKVEACCSINSGQYDKGDIFELADAEAQELSRQGFVVLLGDIVEAPLIVVGSEPLPPPKKRGRKRKE